MSDLRFTLTKIKWAYQERAMIKRGIEWLIWQVAYLLPRSVALIAFIRVYAETMDAPGPDYERVYNSWVRNDLKARQEESKRRASLIEGVLATSDQQDLPSDFAIRALVTFTARDLAAPNIGAIAKIKIDNARQSLIAQAIVEIEKRGRVVEYVTNANERASDNVLQ